MGGGEEDCVSEDWVDSQGDDCAAYAAYPAWCGFEESESKYVSCPRLSPHKRAGVFACLSSPSLCLPLLTESRLSVRV